jgi:hypothetical protein
LRRVRVIPIARGPKKFIVLFYYSRVDKLVWDPIRFVWNLPNEKGEKPNTYIVLQLGQKIMSQMHVVPDVVTKKWGGIMVPAYKLRWMIVWDKEQV